jgi:nucleotide-binding universal stress UspA family protein
MKVVIGVDGSKYGRWAAGWAARLPLSKPVRVTAVHAVDLTYLRAPFMHQYAVIGNEPFLRAEVRRIEDLSKRVVRDTRTMLSSLRLTGKVICQKGAAAATMLRHAKRGDLIAVGSRGLDAMDRFLLGSVSTQVVLHAPCSVLIVKEAPRPVHRMVVAMDGSTASEKAIRFVLHDMLPQWQLRNTELVLVHVMPLLKYPEVKEAGKKLFKRYAGKLVQAGFTVTEAPRLGRPADEIITVARQKQADLIVMGAKGLGSVGRFFLGSVSTKVAQHSACSVLVVR